MNFYKQQTIVITGGSGFLGKHIVDILLRLNYKIVLITHRNVPNYDNTRNLITLNVNTCFDNLREIEADFLVHLATDYGRGPSSIKNIVDVNIHLPLQIIESVQKSSEFLFITCDTFYSKFHVKKECKYTSSKLQLIDNIRYKYCNINTLNIKIEHMYGPLDNKSKFIPVIINNLLHGQTLDLTACEHKRDFIHVKDVASYFVKILQNHKFIPQGINTVELGTGIKTSFKDFILELKLQSGSRSTLNFGKIPYEKDLIWESCAQPSFMNEFWKPKYDVAIGIKDTLQDG